MLDSVAGAGLQSARGVLGLVAGAMGRVERPREVDSLGASPHSRPLARGIVQPVAEDLGVELQFRDGAFVVDRAYAPAIRDVTGGEPERYTFKEAMQLVGPYFGRAYVRAGFEGMVRDHLSRYG